MKNLKQHTIFKSYGALSIKELELYEKDAKENLLYNDIPEEDITDEMVLEEIWENIDLNYDADKLNLDKTLEGRVIAFGKVGRWNGSFSGYKVLKNNLNEILNSFGCDDMYIYKDRYNVHGEFYHHDGTHYMTFREIREDRNIDNFLDKIYNGEELSTKEINYYTKSLSPYIKEIYGC